MIVHLIRHGKTFQDSDTGRDHDRVLKPRGHAQARSLGEYLRSHEHAPTRVVSSPTIRALETSTHLWDALSLEQTIDALIECGESVSSMHGCVIEHARDCCADGHGSLAIVSHNPTVSRFADLLTEGPGAGFRFQLRTGEMVTLEVDTSVTLGSARMLGLYRSDD